MDDNLEIIKTELRRIPGSKKTAGEYMMICCPFHADKTPSCGVYMRRDHPRKTLGYFNCLGCSEHGNWNKLAEKAGLATIQAWNSSEKRVDYDTKRDESALLGDTGLTMRAVYKEMHCPEAIPWPEYMNWRGVSGKLIAAVEGKAINDEYNNGVAVLFPIRIGKNIKGAVKATFHKSTPTQLGYITMPGEWVKKFGLFPFGYTVDLITEKEHKFIILVEGPRDALRLLKLGLPAVAILGANTISKTKLMFVLNLGLDKIYVMPDNDRGGSLFWKNVQRFIPDARRLKLPRHKDEEGKLIKMDPFSMPVSIGRQVKELMQKRHGWSN